MFKQITVRLCIGCTTSDIPWLGCNKCLKKFPTQSFGETPDFSGYNRDEWELRTSSSHRTQSLKLLTATNKSALETLESRIRYLNHHDKICCS